MRLIPTIILFALSVSSALAADSATDGQHGFARCTGCHAIQPGRNGIGPSLADVVGRQSGSAPGYKYSTAMTGAHITWNDASLDKFLTNPQGAVHGTKMFMSVPDAHQRQDIIAYLNTLK
jgi:cytochrome c